MNDQPLAQLLANLPPDCRQAAAILNRGCACLALDHDRLAAALAEDGGDAVAAMLAERPHLFADSLLFVADRHLEQMAALVAAVEAVVALPAYVERILGHSPDIARFEPRAKGVFLGFDFHEGADGPRLIEINTNAGGGLLAATLIDAQPECCISTAGTGGAALKELAGARAYHAPVVVAAFVDMFRAEWRLERGDAPLHRIAIVDEAPAGQYLAPEFELFRRLFLRHGIDALIVDPAELALRDGVLVAGELPVDLVYNRLTDFAFDQPAQAVLREAYLGRAAVVTPHPRAHALFADKRNLIVLRDEDWLRGIGVDAATRATLIELIPETREVTPENAAEFWRDRRRWFFKPFAGYGSRAAYRGEKLTTRVFETIARGGYVAQSLVPPSQRRATSARGGGDLKVDVRNFAYGGHVQLVSARLYQGQTTNFRTPGGGFASVFAVRCGDTEMVAA
ncbi:MAG TPA: hypothetical protein VIS73_11655 [Rhodocyclaceae bacterium]